MKQCTFIDLFGVPGGMSLGFKMAGMRPVGALDISEPGIATYRENFPEVPDVGIIRADASRSDIVEKFLEETGLRRGDVDVVIGGPPCQGFSTVGRVKIASLVKIGKRSGNSNPRFIDDRRNSLYKSFVKFVDKFQPKAVVMENVVGMVSYRDGSVVRQIKDDFRSIGYDSVDHTILNAMDYGVPQSRRRVFFMAVRSPLRVAWPARTHFPKNGTGRSPAPPNSKKCVSVMDAIGDLPQLTLPEKGSKRRDSERSYMHPPECEYQKWVRNGATTVRNNITRWHREKDLVVFRNMKPGGKWSQLSKRDRDMIGYGNDSFDDKWKRLPRDAPSWTVTSHLAKDGYMFIHPTQNRTISVREAARLQSFPDSFGFEGSRSAQFVQIGNAVPPLLALAVAKKVVDVIGRDGD